MKRNPEGRKVGATDFKQQCLALLDDVARTGRPLVVTKHGRPVARVVPIDSTTDALFGSVTLIADKAEAYYSTGDRWESEES